MPEKSRNRNERFSFSPYISEVKGGLQEIDPQKRLEMIENKLPELSDVDSSEPAEGYRNFDILSEAHSENRLANHLLRSASNVLHFEYIYETSEPIRTIREGKIENDEALSVHLVDIYWFSDVVLFSGQSGDISKARSKLQSELVGELRIESISFSSEILTKLLNNEPGRKSLNEKVPEITDVRSLTAKGNENVSQISIHGGENISAYKKYLEETSKITNIIATFKYLNHAILANISESTVHVYTIRSNESLDNSEKLLVSVLFSIALIRNFRSSKPEYLK